MWTMKKLQIEMPQPQEEDWTYWGWITYWYNLERRDSKEGNTVSLRLRSVAGLVIQATGRTEFEDGLGPGSPRGVLSDNPAVHTSSLVTPVL